MDIKLKYGTGALLFGMKQEDVAAVHGKPNQQFDDDESNRICLYDTLKLRLTFYADEELRLGYIISSNHELKLFGRKIIGGKIEEVKEALKKDGLKDWDKEHFDSIENYFNEVNWLTLQSEFGEIIRVELGAIINDNDEFEWKFKSGK